MSPQALIGADGYSLGGFFWGHALADPARSLVIINAALGAWRSA
ncbi:hypothetical protein [Pseudomonas sp. SDI]|nr:hypothetical protein [Pseudomonas sp. SDI]